MIYFVENQSSLTHNTSQEHMTGVFQGKIRPLGLEGLMMPNHVLSDSTNFTLYSPLTPH